jgi:DNA polymerase-3 subunit alpha
VGRPTCLALFANAGGNNGPGVVGEDRYPEAPEWMPKELLAYEKEALGFYISGHPLDRYAGEIRRFTTATCANCMEKGERAGGDPGGRHQRLLGAALEERDGKIAFFSLEDQTGTIEFFVKSRKLEEFRDLLVRDEPMLVTGTVEAPWNEGETARERLVFVDAKLLSKVRSTRARCSTSG